MPSFDLIQFDRNIFYYLKVSIVLDVEVIASAPTVTQFKLWSHNLFSELIYCLLRSETHLYGKRIWRFCRCVCLSCVKTHIEYTTQEYVGEKCSRYLTDRWYQRSGHQMMASRTGIVCLTVPLCRTLSLSITQLEAFRGRIAINSLRYNGRQ